jgi:hypothetical protein
MAFAGFTGVGGQVAGDEAGTLRRAFRVGDDMALGIGRSRYGRGLLEAVIFVMVRRIGVLDGQGYVRIGVVRIAVFVGIDEGRPFGVAVDADGFAAGLPFSSL